MEARPSIADFYEGRSVFITGATGFMGKVLVEKLLRSCPGIDRLYLLMRSSKGKDVISRLQDELINNKVFEKLRLEHPDLLDKLVPVNGDILSDGLGLSLADLQMLSGHVSVVFHSAARIKFDDDLRGAIDSNVKGPQKVMELCRQLKQLKAFVHVSTVFNNLDKGEIAEEIYPGTLDPQTLVNFIDSTDDQLLSSITKQLVGKCPNVYAYTKALGEQLLEKECFTHDIPLVIVRPSIVTAAMKEPMPGWIDNLNGPTGLVAGVGKGLLRAINCNSELIGDLMPVDISINLMIAAAWNRATDQTEETKKIQVFNCSSGSLNPITWAQFNEYGLPVWEKYPTKETIWPPSLTFRTNPFVHTVEVALYHYLPAYLYDFIARMFGKRPFLVRLYDKAHRALSCLDFYTIRQWDFVSKNPILLLEKMSAEDRSTFYFDVRDINWKDYIETYVLGTRKFLFNDEMNSLPTARKNLRRLLWLKNVLQLILIGVVVYFLYQLASRSLDFLDMGILTQMRPHGIGSPIAEQMVLGHINLPQDLPLAKL